MLITFGHIEKWARFTIPPLIGIVAYFVMYITSFFKEPENLHISGLVAFTLLLYAFWEIGHRINLYLDKKRPWGNNWLKRLLLQFFYMQLFCLIIGQALYISGKSLQILLGQNDVIGWVHIGVTTGFILLIVTFVFGLQLGIIFIKQWQQAQLKAEKLQKENITARLETLTAQISPHFLFNNFNTLYGLIHEDTQLAGEYLLQLSEIYRYVLQHRDVEIVSLSQELVIGQSYLYLLSKRYGNNLQYNIDIPDQSLNHYFLPPLSLQMLLENAIKHNIIEDDSPLQVDIYKAQETLVVSNSYQPKNKSAENTQIGLNNLKARYAYLSNIAIEISQQNGHFQVILPLLNKPEAL